MNTFLDYVLYFFLYSFCGWVGETIYCSVGARKFVNRGFLTGPMCPIYGSGAIVLGVCLMPFYYKWGYSKWYIIALVIVLGMILADIVEFLTSLIMEKLFNARWWDYSNRKFNIQGRICLKNTMHWGIATGLFIYVIHPRVTETVARVLTPQQRNQIIVMILIVFCFDLFFAVKSAADIRKFMTKLNKLYDSVTSTASSVKSGAIHTYENIHDTVQKGEFKFAAWFANIRKQLSELETPGTKSGRKKRTDAIIKRNVKRLIRNAKDMSNAVNLKLKSINDIVNELKKDFSDGNDDENTTENDEDN